RWGRRRRRWRRSELQETPAADRVLLGQHPAHLQPLVCNLDGLSRRADRGPGSPAHRGPRLRGHRERAVHAEAEAAAGEARCSRRQLSPAKGRRRSGDRRTADAPGLSGHPAGRRGLPERRRDHRDPYLDHGMRAEQLTAALAGLVLLLMGASAWAEPYLAVRTGAKCSDCHTNMDGGGKRTAFAHIHAHDILHDLQILPLPRGLESFNGELNQYVSIGGDLRVRSTTTFADTPNAQGRVAMNRAFRNHVDSETLNVPEALGYINVDLWPDVLQIYGDFNAAGGGVTAREAFALLKLPFQTFMKGGRFFPPFALRVYGDNAYILTTTGLSFQHT